jgi:paraquat-inducible protein B
MSRRANPRLVGAFVMIAVALAVVGIVAFGSGRLFHETHRFIVYFDQDLGGLSSGSKVKFRGVQVGQVREVLLGLSQTAREWDDISLPVIIEIDQTRIRRSGARIMDFGQQELVDSVIAAGFRASVRVESFVTGEQYIDFGVYPESPIVFRGLGDEPYPELPAIKPSSLGEIESDARAFMRTLATIDLAGLVDSASAMMGSISQMTGGISATVADSMPRLFATLERTLLEYAELSKNVDSTLMPFREDLTVTLQQATATMSEIEATFEGMQAVFEPGTALPVRLNEALAELSEAARALRSLAEFLERNPSALIRGKPERNE